MEENVLNQELVVNKEVEDDDEFRHLNNPVEGIKPIAKKYLSVPKNVRQSGNKYCFSDGDASVEITVASPEIIRVRLAPHSVFLEDFSYAVPKLESKFADFKLTETADEYLVSTESISCHISKTDFHISFSDKDGRVTSS